MVKKSLNFSEILGSLLKVYKNIIRARNKKYGYEGPLLKSNELLKCSPNLDELFSQESFEYEVKYNDQKPIEILLTAAIQIGIQQGIDMCHDSKFETVDCNDYNLEDWIEIEKYIQLEKFRLTNNVEFKCSFMSVYDKGIKAFGTDEEFKKWLYSMENVYSMTDKDINILLNQIVHGYPL